MLTMPILEPIIHGAECVKKHPTPLLTPEEIPYDCALVFNAGVEKINGKYVMIFRNDYGTNEELVKQKIGFKGTAIGVAISDNGVDGWKVREIPLCNYVFADQDAKHDEVWRLYDPRITVIEGEIFLCLAMDTRHGVCGAIAKVDENFEKLEILSVTTPDNRNMVLFPEKIDGYYYRLERPFPVYSRGGKDRFDIWISKSPDMKFWGESKLVLAVEDVPWANNKIGPAAPPVKTEKGWLATFHAVDAYPGREDNSWEGVWPKRYTAGIMLLDLEDPSKVVGMSKEPLMVPELPWEADEGYRRNTIFPGGMILEDDGEVKMYYGASDYVECLATANVDDLIALCKDPR